MRKMKKIIFIIVFLVVPVFFFAVNAKPVLAADNSTQAIQQEIQSLMQQLIALMKELVQLQTNQTNSQRVVAQPPVQTPTYFQNSNLSQSNANPGTLTVNASGVTAYVSINHATPFAYTAPIMLNNGDTYSVTASTSSSTGSGNSTTKCSGTASSNGSYTCNITMQ